MLLIGAPGRRNLVSEYARPVVRYYFSFASPYAYLADTRIDAEVEAAGGILEPIPVPSPPRTGPEPEGIAQVLLDSKRSYTPEDCGRWAKRLGVPFRVPDDSGATGADPTNAMAGWYFARERGGERAYRNAVFVAHWGEARSLADHAVLADAAERAGLERDAFLEALRTKRLHDEIPKVVDAALRDRVFGVPLFVVNGTRYWGNDRLDFALAALREAGSH